jgi:hypothetical protein
MSRRRRRWGRTESPGRKMGIFLHVTGRFSTSRELSVELAQRKQGMIYVQLQAFSALTRKGCRQTADTTGAEPP